MKITMYEFLGLVKDGKASDITTNFMFDGHKYNLLAFLDEYTLDINSLNWEIKILEEEKKIPEKLEEFGIIQYNLDLIIKNQNKLIDYLKSKGE